MRSLVRHACDGDRFRRLSRRRSWGSLVATLRRFAPADGRGSRLRSLGPTCRSPTDRSQCFSRAAGRPGVEAGGVSLSRARCAARGAAAKREEARTTPDGSVGRGSIGSTSGFSDSRLRGARASVRLFQRGAILPWAFASLRCDGCVRRVHVRRARTARVMNARTEFRSIVRPTSRAFPACSRLSPRAGLRDRIRSWVCVRRASASRQVR